jgi:hypothetical protein
VDDGTPSTVNATAPSHEGAADVSNTVAAHLEKSEQSTWLEEGEDPGQLDDWKEVRENEDLQSVDAEWRERWGEPLWRAACKPCSLVGPPEAMLGAVDRANDHNRARHGGRRRWAVVSGALIPGKAKHAMFYWEELMLLTADQLEGTACVECGEGGAGMHKLGVGPAGEVFDHPRCSRH